MNPVINSLMDHRSVRKYTDRPIEPDILDTILAAGTRAATGGNLQLYTLLVVDDPETLEKLDQALEVPFISRSGCSVAVLALADQFRVRRWLTMHSEREVINHRPYSFFLAVSDALIALQNIVIAAESLGLGTCYLGGGLELDVHELFGAPELVFPAGMVCLGYPEVTPKLSQRLPLEAVVHRNRYHKPTDDDINAWYAERDRVWDTVPDSRKAELAEQGLSGIAQALSVQKFSSERVEQRSRGMLRNLKKSGFDLVTGMDTA
ncbi:MAG: nitroreductase family protein [candidate division Zixibacteria bacterium]|nr:nitroreductase family protein [candidate division Zixibacteria bacterium]